MEEFRNCFTASEGTTNTDTTNSSQEAHRFSPGSQVHLCFSSACPLHHQAVQRAAETSQLLADIDPCGWFCHKTRGLSSSCSGVYWMDCCYATTHHWQHSGQSRWREAAFTKPSVGFELCWCRSITAATAVWPQHRRPTVAPGKHADGDRKASLFVLFLVESGFNLEPD